VKHHLAYFIGGPLDGTRSVVRDMSPQREHFHLHAEPTRWNKANKDLGSPYITSAEVDVTRCVYRAFMGPINPVRMGGQDLYYTGVDADVMVYFYMGSEKL
jgi:hypothetical protein